MNQEVPYKTLSIENLYESIVAPIEEGGIPKFADLEYEEFITEIYNLIDAGKLFPSRNESGNYCVTVDPQNKSFDEVQRESRSLSDIGKTIFHFLIELTNSLWTIVLGAQKTKTAQMIRCIQELLAASVSTERRIIPFMISLNVLDLTEQSTIRFLTSLNNIRIFVFSSRKMDTKENELLNNNEISFNPDIHHIKMAIDEYVKHNGKMPLFISLANPTQLTKVCNILEKIVLLRNEKYDCGYNLLFDEADAIYPTNRNKLLKYIVQENNFPQPANFGTYWVSATLDIQEKMKFPEVQSAFQYAVNIDPSVEENYRNIDSEDSLVPNKYLHQELKESNNAFAKRVIQEHLEHFRQLVTGKNGVSYHRRIIVLADLENDKQKSLAKLLAKEQGFASIVYNQTGFNIMWRTSDGTVVSKIFKRKDFPKKMRTKCINEKLKYIFDDTPEIRNVPLFIIGNKMIDRGLSFHYAPRNDEDAWLLTDIIIGHYTHAEYRRAAQAVARLWGVIAHCKEYCGSITHWIDARTREMVRRDARMTKHIQDNSFVPQSITYLTEQAEQNIEEEEKISKRHIIQSKQYFPTNLDLTVFENEERVSQSLEKIQHIISTELLNDLGKSIGVDKNHPASYKICEGYIISTRKSAGGLENLTANNRIILNKIGDTELITLDEISLTNSINTIDGNKNCQSFVIFPVYPNELSKPEEIIWIYRYDLPLMDSKNVICFIDDEVIFDNHLCIIKEVYSSKNGDRVKARLSYKDTGLQPDYKNEFGELDSKIPGDQFKKNI